MLMTRLTALSIPSSGGAGEFCLELEGEFLVVEDRLFVLVGFISSAGDKMIWRSLMLEAASASTLAETSLNGDTFNREWELPWTSWDWKHSNNHRVFKIEIPTYNWNSSVAQLPCSIGLRSRSKAIKKAGFAGRRRVFAIIGGIFLMASLFVHLKAYRSNGSCPRSHHAWTS